MRLVFLTPLGALIALAALLPAATVYAVSKRADRIRRIVDLPRLPVRRLLGPVGALLGVAGLLGLAAAQPVLQRMVTRDVRTDAEAFVVVDVSRSMLARDTPGARTRFERAKAAANEIRASMPEIRVGVASLTDRVLPHLFPSPDLDVFATTIDRSLDIERPPPYSSFQTTATSLDSLSAVATRGFFSRAAKHRLIVVLTDGESQPVNPARVGRRLGRPPAISTVFVQFWGPDERVFTRGVAEPRYLPDPSARTTLEGLAAATGGNVYSERDLAAAGRKSREFLRSGPTRVQGQRRGRIALAPYLAAAAFLPLALLLGRRDR